MGSEMCIRDRRERWEKLKKEGKFPEDDISPVILWMIVAFFVLGVVAI